MSVCPFLISSLHLDRVPGPKLYKDANQVLSTLSGLVCVVGFSVGDQPQGTVHAEQMPHYLATDPDFKIVF